MSSYRESPRGGRVSHCKILNFKSKLVEKKFPFNNKQNIISQFQSVLYCSRTGKMCLQIIEEETDRREGNGCRCCLGGWNSFNSMPHYRFSTQDDLKKRINRRTDAWQNGCFRKMDDPLVNTTPNHHPLKMDVLPKTFLQIILVAKWLVRHSSASPKKQRRPLPSLFF